MAGERDGPGDIAPKLRQPEVLQGQGKSVSQAAEQIGVRVEAYYQWRKEYGSMSCDQLKRLKGFEMENQRRRRAVSRAHNTGTYYDSMTVSPPSLRAAAASLPSKTSGPAGAAF